MVNVILKRFNVKNVFSNASKKTISFIKINTKKAFVAAKSFIKAIKDKITATSFFVKLKKFVLRNKLAVKIASLVLVFATVITLFVTVSGLTLGYKVVYNGKVIATVNDKSISYDAFNIAQKNVSVDMQKYLDEPTLSLTISFKDKFSSADEVADDMLSATDEIVYTTALIVNGEYVAFADKEKVNELLELRRTAFYSPKFESSAEFVDEIKTESGYFMTSDVANGKNIDEVVASLNVKTVYTKVSDVTIPYSKKQVNSSLQKVGYKKVTTTGKNGLSRKTEMVETINGEVLKTTLLNEKVVTEPVTQVTTVGTARNTISKADRENITAAGFICPLAKGTYKISSYWGDGRNHKGIDLCANYGVSIYSAAAGKVTFAGWHGDYGYSVVIDHGNGLQTRYAHCSKLFVKTGTRVSQGETIAAIGSTGYSTGNHLHFEVIVNGTRVNPAPYIGL